MLKDRNLQHIKVGICDSKFFETYLECKVEFGDTETICSLKNISFKMHIRNFVNFLNSFLIHLF